MKITITGRHVVVTKAIREYIIEKTERLVKYEPKLTTARVILSVEKYRHSAEFNISAKHLRIVISETTEDMYQSIDAAIGRLEKALRRHRDKVTGHRIRKPIQPSVEEE